ncbi:hypothetical protein SERLADRAFT_432395 [Serpula lacrymans var. lacrymans S7.9]|uniref:Wbp11/ELF5/Saf1 N-terminal domain-containing protein n=1 Tax=Serpula lacrymans var. lacrymans (strain S7.9) TaxID=578457 RepID=F8NF11_SERL9|nr:uncharacterized protein SERLADRAFT_432395 [Serpula lacrymans var. lacrymans S7.9]EGO30770.1 hypothetical protein SERLADRAFT_432395 [Serpula lacrymans var. lacrymans S7.9]
MTKGKNVNPADAFRKAQRKKELKKASNKVERTKARDFALVKKDTHDLEDQVAKLEVISNRSAAEHIQLANLKAELIKIMKKKEDYVEDHPEHRRLVFRGRKVANEDDVKISSMEQKRNLFNKHGLPRHPARSIYYNSVMNPYGVPPPGMPYIERPFKPDEVASDEEDHGDDGIVMPAGPPPTAGSEDVPSDSDGDIPLPVGPPPPKDSGAYYAAIVACEKLIDFYFLFRLIPSIRTSIVALLLWTTVKNSLVPPPPLPPHPVGLFQPLHVPMVFPPFMYPPPPPGPMNVRPPSGPPPAFSGPALSMSMPPPPPGFFSRRAQSVSAMQAPLSSAPHQTYQAHAANRVAANAYLPRDSKFPLTTGSSVSGPITTAATVSAAPQLRDFRKEATAFVPASLKRKKPTAAGPTASSNINAAPSMTLV